uniref:Uncharacterized protein n=1 Tax=Zea mays TaxID=4577 RepID=C4J5J8_MAIZE|nr:unknown [Zea mays]
MSVYLSPLPISTNKHAHSKAYRMLLYIRELIPVNMSFYLKHKFCSKKSPCISPCPATRLQMLIQL